jgi:hypothetical protein
MVAAADISDVPLGPAELLFVPHRKRLTYSYIINEDGGRALRLDYGRKEILFDEEHLFAFGERLTQEASFTGELATRWGAGYAWDEIRPLLEALLAEGVIQRGEEISEPRGGGLASPRLPPAVCPEPRYWSVADCESITRELSGHAVELGHLEAFLPIYRVAHAALDADDRQVGEANVNPWRLRLERTTEWRACQYPGSRYRDELPMNVTALRAMIKYWKPLLATISEVRAELAMRIGISQRPWTIGELHVLSCAVLALPAYQLMKRGGETPQRRLHPVLSSLFRVTDGIRMTTAEMVHSIEDPCPASAPLTAAALHTRAEQQGLFISSVGVCSGPKQMIDDFLAVAVDGLAGNGATGTELPADVRELLSELPAALDYGLYGIQAWALSHSVWVAMTRAHDAVRELLERAGGDSVLLGRLRSDVPAILAKQIAIERDRGIHMNLYVDSYELARRGSRAPVGEPQLLDEIVPVRETAAHRAAVDQLRAMLGSRLPASAAGPIAEALVEYLRNEQSILAALEANGEAINVLLDRPRPVRRLGVRDLHVSHFLRRTPDTFPYLFDSLDEALGVYVACTADTIEILDRKAGAGQSLATASGR